MDQKNGNDGNNSNDAHSKNHKAEQEMTRLDNSIANQRNRYNGASERDEEAKRRSRRPMQAGLKKPPPSATLSNLERDVMAKQQARGGISVGAAARSNLARMESDIAAKSLASPRLAGHAKSVPGAFSEVSAHHRGLHQLESDMVAKARSPSAHIGSLTQLEADLAAKSNVTHRSTQQNHQQLADMENALAAKMRSASSPSSPPSQIELSRLEHDVVAKQSAASDPPKVAARPSPGQLSSEELARLDARLAYKTSIPMDDQVEDISAPTEGDGVARMPTMSEKLVASKGVQPDTVHASAEDKQGGDNMVAAMQASYKADAYGGHQGGNTTADEENGGENRLAVAVAVDDDKSDDFIPAAVEYDNDAKPPIYKRRRVWLYTIMAIIVLLVVTGGIVIASSKGEAKGEVEEELPSASPTTVRESFGIRERLELIVGSDKLNDEEGPHYRAMQWLIYDDPAQLIPDDRNFIQRYVLSLLYFSTAGEDGWLSCNPAKDGESSLCSYQRMMSQGGYQYVAEPAYRWLSEVHECEWPGVNCNQFNTTNAIWIFGQHLNGTIPSELTRLPSLQALGLGVNHLRGTIPKEIGEMKKIAQLELHSNTLTGPIPDELWSLLALDQLGLGGNKLSGTISTLIGQLRDLKSLYLWGNKLVGSLPTELGSLGGLLHCQLNTNELTGTIPSEIGLIPRLTGIQLGRNKLSGSLPSEIGQVSYLKGIRLQLTGIGGELPIELFNLTRMTRLILFGSQFSGTISTLIGKFSSLLDLDLSENRFEGAIPSEIGGLSSLVRGRFDGNRFEGSMPSEICSLRTHEDSTATAETKLLGLTADCLAGEATGFTQIECDTSCCTGCCDVESGDCKSINQ